MTISVPVRVTPPRICVKCGGNKFTQGPKSQCIDCKNARQAAYRKKIREDAAWHASEREKARLRERRQYQRDREKRGLLRVFLSAERQLELYSILAAHANARDDAGLMEIIAEFWGANP